MARWSPGRSHRVSCVQWGIRSSLSFSAGRILPCLSQIAEGLEPEGSFAQLAWLFNLCSSQLCMANAPVGPTQRSRVSLSRSCQGVQGQIQPHSSSADFSIPGRSCPAWEPRGPAGPVWCQQLELGVKVQGEHSSSAEGTLGTALV